MSIQYLARNISSALQKLPFVGPQIAAAQKAADEGRVLDAVGRSLGAGAMVGAGAAAGVAGARALPALAKLAPPAPPQQTVGAFMARKAARRMAGVGVGATLYGAGQLTKGPQEYDQPIPFRPSEGPGKSLFIWREPGMSDQEWRTLQDWFRQQYPPEGYPSP